MAMPATILVVVMAAILIQTSTVGVGWRYCSYCHDDGEDGGESGFHESEAHRGKKNPELVRSRLMESAIPFKLVRGIAESVRSSVRTGQALHRFAPESLIMADASG